MTFRRFFSLVGLILALGSGSLFLQAQPAQAQVDSANLTQVGETAELGNAAPQIIAGRLINIFLASLGIIFLCIVLYAGFTWMTAGGDTEKVEKSQKTIRNGIIGLVIIACAWAITSFVINKLAEVTQGDGALVSSEDGIRGSLGAAGGSVAFQVRSITPVGVTRLRNIQVRFLFSREVLATTASSSISVLRASDRQPVAGTISVVGGLVIFTPNEACPAPNATRKCFTENTEYIARVTPELRARSGLALACGKNVPVCEVKFTSGPLVDVTAPVAAITTPLDGQGIPLGDTVRVTARATDEGGISLMEMFVDGKSIGQDAGSASTTPQQYDGTVIWDTRTVTTGTHRIEAHVWDVDSNSVTTTAVTVVVRPRNFFNGVQDGPGLSADGSGTNGGAGGAGSSGSGTGGAGRGGLFGETGIDCGGPSGGACAGAACTLSYTCASGLCASGRCVEQPIIGSFNPVDGRPGTFVTITGANFGTTMGQVTFGGRVATLPAACSGNAAFSWSPTQIVIAVPEGAVTSSIQVTHGTNRLSDATNDDRGPRLPDFRVNGVARPGLCAIRPGSATVGEYPRLAVAGISLGTTAGRLYFNDQEAPISAWRSTGIDLAAPLVAPGMYAVRARIGDLESNPVSFQFNDRVFTAGPVIDQLRPATGTVGSYVTIVGRNFGNAGRVFFRNPATNAVGEANTTFPALCGSSFWGNTAVMVKVPATLRGGLGEEQAVRGGSYEIYVQRDGIAVSNRVPFRVFDGVPGPGICSIQPVAGPVGTGVTIVGEHFGSSIGSVTFAGTSSSRPSALLTSDSWQEAEIRTRVPAGATTGFVRVSVGGQESNDAFFSVASCATTPGICGASRACCPDGSCAVGGVCPALSVATSTFAWRSSTGRIYSYPQVVEECSNEEPPSPSPRSLSTCVNAQAVVRFTTHIERSSITTSNVIVRRCTGTTGDPCATGTPETVAGTLGFTAGLTQDHVVFTPTGDLWVPNTTYQVILTTGIRSTEGRNMLENAELYGRGNAYSYRFKTKAGTDLCSAGSVSVVPHNWAMTQIGERKEDYTLSARSTDDICVQINAATLGWAWTLGGAPGRASIEASTRDLTGAPLAPSRTDVITVVARGGTDRDPVLVNVDLTRPTPPAPVRGTGRLTIQLAQPRVISYAPNCNEACVNAAVWARFNVAMSPESLFRTVAGRSVPNIEIKRCTNESCLETDRTLDLSEAIIDLITPPGTSATNTMMKIEPSIAAAPDAETGEPVRTSQLEPGKFYTATIIGGLTGLRSAYGNLPLTELNDSDPVGFTWKFRVKTGPTAYCSVARVEVAPSEKYEDAIGLRQLFIASPISSPDVCSRDGQMLISERSTRWGVTEVQPTSPVVDFVRIGATRTSVSIADRLPAFCTNQCLNAGSNGVFGRSAVCGNGAIETADTDYCHMRSAPTRACEVGSTDCVTRDNVACLLLPVGSTDTEECDNGSANGTAGECSISCLYNPVRRVNETPAGTCGNGTLQRGEQCDVGRACVGGATPGRDCTSDAASCGTGGSCQVVERRGCSDHCQALGAARGGSTCGNGDVSTGETCDDRSDQRGAGCTDQCLHRGSSSAERRLCGNGRIEPGESCEVQTAGNRESQYCSPGTRGCVAGTRFSASCDAQTCLNLGTNRCARGTDAGCCGNARIEPGEDCDGGAGCSARCLLQGSSATYPQPSLCGDRVTGTGEQCEAEPIGTTTTGAPVAGAGTARSFEITNRQLFEIVGLREPTRDEMTRASGRMSATINATYQAKTGNATYGVQCNFTRENECRTAGTGLTSAGCCSVRPTAVNYPRAGSTDVCRNVLISSTFNQLMDEGSVRGNFLVSSQAQGAECPAGTTRLDRAVPTAFDWSSPVRSFIARVKAWFAPAIAAETSPWCVGTVRGTVVFETDTELRQTTAAFLLDEALNAETAYQVTLLGDPAISMGTVSSTRRGLRGANGVYTNGNISWTFRTGERVCTIDELRLADTNSAHPTVFYKSNEAHRYIGRAVSYNHDEVVSLSPIPRLYDWAWREWASSRPNVLRVLTATTTPQISIATTTAQNQRGTSVIATGVTITADRVNASSTVGTSVDASLLSTVLLCDNPWVPPGTLPGQPPRFEDQLYHFAFNYCLDAGQSGIGDDLPELVVNRQADNASDLARGVKRQYIFSFDRPAFRSDAIGLRVMANPLHLSVKDWYAAQGFAGSPQSTTVDGYEAMRDGSTLYIAAANVDETAGNITTDIYILSFNPNAAPQTRTIFEQVVDSLTFNTNVLHNADNICRTRSGSVFHASGSTFPTTCTADWECVRYDAGGYCASSKDKLQRDLKRMADIQYMSAQLEGAKARDGRYPTINTGTFLQTFVTSRWPSWQTVFGAAVGKALPEDPLNVHLTCGQCVSSRQACMDDSDCGGTSDRCVAVDGFDPMTCWNATNSTYRCPVLDSTNPQSVSRLYQYRSVDGGSRYELGTELEYQPIQAYSPSVLPETRRCVSTNASNGRACVQDTDCNLLAADRRTIVGTGTCTPQGGHLQFGGICRGQTMGLGGICGDGVVGTGEVCEPGQTRQNECAIGGVAGAGRRQQVCQADCRAYVDVAGAACISRVQCGNGRLDAGETCDDGDLNGRYGHCSRTCTGFSAVCGDGQLSAGETCDLGADSSGRPLNGLYCDTSGYFAGSACTLSQTCSLDCQTTAPHCGDGVVQTESMGDGGQVEECDGNPSQTYTGYVCSAGKTGATCDPANRGSDCALGTIGGTDLCGRVEADRSCSGIKAGLCAGGIVVDGVSRDRSPCSCDPGQTSCTSTVCGAAYRCVMYDTQRTRSCAAPGSGTTSIKQCHWNPWSTCQPANFCGNGVIDTGETCDDGNRNDNDACTNRCLANTCGDGVMSVGAEECDYGSENGQGCVGAEYGSTCAACTNQCRMTASSGGFCGNGAVDGSEQCDSADFNSATGVQASTGLTCSGLGFDYAERVRCNSLAAPTEVIEVASTDAATRCVAGTARDIISCNRTCGYNGCQTCSTQTGTATIRATVKDAVYSNKVVPGATVTLLQNGRRVTTQTTNAAGEFTFSNLNGNRSCGGYRVYVEYTRDNSETPDYDEGANGGYWNYESDLFSVPTFATDGIQNTDRNIFLLPRVARGEAMALHMWNNAPLGGRNIYAHLILPASRAYDPYSGYASPGVPNPYLPVVPSCNIPFDRTTPDSTGRLACWRDIRAQAGAGGYQGHVSMVAGRATINGYPYARLFCPSSGSLGDCADVSTGPQVIRYKLGAGTGKFVYYLQDRMSVAGATVPSYRWFQQTQSQIWVVTNERVYRIKPPDATPAGRCGGKYWLGYEQDIATGEVTVRRDGSAYQCGGDPIPGAESTGAPNLPTAAWATDRHTSWMYFGEIAPGEVIDWDPRR